MLSETERRARVAEYQAKREAERRMMWFEWFNKNPPHEITEEEKLYAIIEHLTGMIDGGYPGDHVWIGETMAYTSSRGGGLSETKHDSQLGTITKSEMLTMFDKAAAYLLDGEPDKTLWMNDIWQEPPDGPWPRLGEAFRSALYEAE